MIKLSALNVKSDEESGSEELVAREGLDEIASQEYAKALDLQRKGNLPDAIQLLKDLLDTQVLFEVKKPTPNEKVTNPLFTLKYLCYKNLATMLSTSGEIEAAIETYCLASELDDTDVTLWHRLGLLCINAKRYEMALAAFKRGLECNSQHWPCLDRVVTLLLGLNLRQECIAVIYEALQLDPGYLRGLVYRRHIYTVYKFVRDYLEYVNPIYKWDESNDEIIDEEKAKKLLKEAEDIREIFIEQQRAEQFEYILPHLKLRKPITQLTWKSVGDSLVDMHNFMTEHCFSHACPLEILFKMEKLDDNVEVVDEELKESNIADRNTETNIIDTDKNIDIVLENDNNDLSDKDKPVTDTEKIESDNESTPEPKTQKKKSVRRRGRDLSNLQQWEWYNRRSGRKNPTTTTTYKKDESIYITLRRMIPIALLPTINEKKENEETETDVEMTDLNKVLQEKQEHVKEEIYIKYFDSECEEKDVRSFITKYTEIKHDIIDILQGYLSILSEKWRLKWPKGLEKVFIEANKCYNIHVDIPGCTDDNKLELIHYTSVNLLAEELIVNEKLNLKVDDNNSHDLSVVEPIGIILSLKPHIFSSTDCLEYFLRQLWLKLHIHKLNKCDELELDSLYALICEFNALGDLKDTYNLNVINFTFKPDINLKEIIDSITFIERNMKLKTIKNLYYKGSYEEVLTIVIDCFEHFKTLSKQQEERLSLDFAVYLTIILDTYWALGRVEDCFQWCFTCLHEALKYYFRYTSGSGDYEKWTMTVFKILCSIEHILSTEGLSCLDALSAKDLSQGLEDLIRIIGHQVETNAAEMPFDSVAPWIIMYYILQREEDQGRGRTSSNYALFDYVPYPLMVLFIGHEKLGKREWCSKSDGRLLYFILDTVVPRLRSPSLSKCLEMVGQYLEQCAYCLFGTHARKFKYIAQHNATPKCLDWHRAQQLYDIFRPSELPVLEGKVAAITVDAETVLQRILDLLPPECDPHKYVPEMEKYMKGIEEKIPVVPPLLPYKMKDIYFLLGDYYFKKDKLGIKYNTLDVIINNDRFESWAQISLAKAVKLEYLLNSCKNLKNDKEFLNPATTAIRCFKRSLLLDPTRCDVWIEYGNFVYAVHSFCSRLLKQASESLSMEDFESLEKQKEDMLDTTQKCFNTVLLDYNSSNNSEKSNEETWQIYYMLGKVAEKRNKPPSIYLDYYRQGIKSLLEIATYPTKINYSSPTKRCIEVLEFHYRIHASILKYIEQHENKPIPESVGKVFASCIAEWLQGPFSRKKKQDRNADTEREIKLDEPIQAANILKRSISDAGEEDNFEAKRLKLESAAAKVRRSASYDTERFIAKEISAVNESQNIESNTDVGNTIGVSVSEENTNFVENQGVRNIDEKNEKAASGDNQNIMPHKKVDSSSSTSSTSSSDSSSSDSSTDSSSDSVRDSDTSSKSSIESKPLTEDEIMKIVSACLDALEDCASRFPQHYKAIYRLAHYHFYYKKGRDIERCRDLMLSTFTSRFGQKLGGLFSERKGNNFFNNVWKIPSNEVDRGGSFPFHMNRSVLLTLEILKEIDDHVTLLDLSLHLQKIPDRDKKYLRDSDRDELAQQAFSLCVQSLKGQLIRFSQQADLKSNDVERQALKSLLLEIYNAYQRVQRQPNSKQFTNLLIDGYKLLSSGPFENKNLVDLSMKYCQSLRQNANLDKSKNLQKKQAAKAAESVKSTTITSVPSKADAKMPVSSSSSTSTTPVMPKISAHDMVAAFQNYVPITNDQILAQQTAAALSYLNKISTMALQVGSSLPYSLPNSFQAEFYRQCVGQPFSPFSLPPAKKQKRAPKASSTNRPQTTTSQVKTSKPAISQSTSVVKAIPTPVITSQKSTSLAPSMGTVLPMLPASMTANLSAFGSSSHSHSKNHGTMPAQAHMTSSSTVNTAMHSKPPMPHQQVSPGKTLQEKLAERQKSLPTVSKASSHDNVSREINQSISRLPSSLTITKTSAPKQPLVVGKRPEAKKSLPFSETEPRTTKPITSDEIIILDDD